MLYTFDYKKDMGEIHYFFFKSYVCFVKSLDGIIDDQKLIEIKAPYAAKDTNNGVEAVEKGKVK